MEKLPKLIRVQIHREEDGTYWAESLDAPGCFTVGATIEETLTNYEEALRCHFDLTNDDKGVFRLEPVITAKLVVLPDRALARA
jgi:predicted RNase H-like HicB family nuclease